MQTQQGAFEPMHPERASPNTRWPTPNNYCTMAVPMKPVATVTNTRIIVFILLIQICAVLAGRI